MSREAETTMEQDPAVLPGPLVDPDAPGVLVTGASGEVGHAIIRELATAGCDEIVGLDLDQVPPSTAALCHATVHGDIRDDGSLRDAISDHRVGIVVHLAALLSSRAEENPKLAHEVNVGGTINLLTLASDHSVHTGRPVRFLYPSSIAVYGMPDYEEKIRAGRVKEDTFRSPWTIYGMHKLFCESIGAWYARRSSGCGDVDFRSIRYPGLISTETLPSGGTSDYGPEMIHAVAAGKPYRCFVSESVCMPFMIMSEAVRATLSLIAAERSSLTRCSYNITGFSATAGDIARELRDLGPGAQVEFDPDPVREAIVRSWPGDVDCSAAMHDWGFAKGRDLRRSLEEDLVPRLRKRYGN